MNKERLENSLNKIIRYNPSEEINRNEDVEVIIEKIEKISGMTVLLEDVDNGGFKSVVGVVIDFKNKKILLGTSLSEDSRFGFLSFPGGGIDSGETINEAVKREVYEETNLAVEPISSPIEHRTNPSVCFVYCKYLGGDIKFNSEFSNMNWYSPDEVVLDFIFKDNRDIVKYLREKINESEKTE